MSKFIKLDFVPFSSDLGLLVLRVWLGISIFALHGLAKFKNFGGTVQMFHEKMGFPTPLAAGAVLAESVFAILLVLGLGTRWAAGFLAATMGVAFFVAHQASFDPKSATGSGELAFIYLAGFVALLIAGAGRYSVDSKLK
ncbi:MAG TPA: DoxX family protein [Verrucomicrobium sp.]|nr:DoxX family protein [Verrucomicrobium sp.]